jgi:multicomponent Na+:H+ antiporter subunit D
MSPDAAPVKPAPIPPGMYIGMGLTAAICIAIGVYPALLYNLLPYPVDYRPYTAPHIVETIQILVFTGIGFWLLIKVLKPKNTISLDIDWFYRRPARLAYNVFVVPVSRLSAGRMGRAGVIRLLVSVGANPSLPGPFGVLTGEDGREDTAREYDPDRSRLPIGILLVTVLLCFVVLIAWGLLR